MPKTIARVERIGLRAHLEEQPAPDAIADTSVAEKVAALKTMRMSSAELYDLYPPPRARRGHEPDDCAAHDHPRAAAGAPAPRRRKRQVYELMVDFWSTHRNPSLRASRCSETE